MRTYTPKQMARKRWQQMVYRCTDPRHHAWRNYGGRGIKVATEWLDFETYYAAVGDRPAGMSLDRIDNDGNYEPSNVRWATPVEQRANRRHDPNLVKTHCPQGHPYAGDNLYVTTDSKRACRTCKRDSTRRSRLNNVHAQPARGAQEGAIA
jgi:hypothetical protein